MTKKARPSMVISAAVGMALALTGIATSAQAAPVNGGMENVAPVRPANQAMVRPGQFVLNGDRDVELIRFSQPHDMMVCLPARVDDQGRPDLTGANAYPVTVTWDSDAAQIWPGDCLGFDAAQAKVSPSARMPKGDHVTGQLFIL